MITVYDKIIVATVLISAMIIYLLFAGTVFGEQPETVVISVDGREYASYNLAEISEVKNVEINTEFGYNTIEITSDGARVTDASCPDKTDIQSGKITKPGQMLVCVPNRVTVRIIGKGAAKVDKVTY
jgi:hypothetical protein